MCSVSNENILIESNTNEITLETKVKNKWKFYLHYCDEKNWDIDSYINVCEINNMKEAVLLSDYMCIDMLKRAMLFVMKDNIKPLWEDENNINGGCFSYKVPHKNLMKVWRLIYFSLILENLSTNKTVNSSINGISLSPKKNFCIIKIWLSNCNTMDSDVINKLESLPFEGCLFRKHSA